MEPVVLPNDLASAFLLSVVMVEFNELISSAPNRGRKKRLKKALSNIQEIYDELVLDLPHECLSAEKAERFAFACKGILREVAHEIQEQAGEPT